jgi:hypothetical protein
MFDIAFFAGITMAIATAAVVIYFFYQLLPRH